MYRCPFFLLILLACFFCCDRTLSQSKVANKLREKRVVITFDDLPLNGPQLKLSRIQAMTERLTTVVRNRRIPAVGFVNESQLYVDGEMDRRIALLKTWADAGVELANHTYSHISFRDSGLEQYQDDFIRGDTAIARLMKQKGGKVKYFRHPFLHMGPTEETERKFERFLTERGYRIAPMTIDSVDWMILSAYLIAKNQSDNELARKISMDYLELLDRRFEYSEKAADLLFDRDIPQILLLHANELNADNFAAVLEVIKRRGYKFVSFDEAIQDPVYGNPPKYTPSSDWLYHWSVSKGKDWSPPRPPDYIQKAFNDGQSAK
jgi:peptidoglycan-N-acetylglucosamine deacetylase